MNQIKAWILVMILQLVIAVVAISFIFSPAVIHTTDSLSGQEMVSTTSAYTLQGMASRVDAWKTYPQYNIGLGFIAFLAFAGAIHASGCVYSLREVENGN